MLLNIANIYETVDADIENGRINVSDSPIFPTFKSKRRYELMFQELPYMDRVIWFRHLEAFRRGYEQFIFGTFTSDQVQYEGKQDCMALRDILKEMNSQIDHFSEDEKYIDVERYTGRFWGHVWGLHSESRNLTIRGEELQMETIEAFREIGKVFVDLD